MVPARTSLGRDGAGADSVRLRQCTLKILRCLVYARRHVFDHLRNLRDLTFRLAPLLFIHIFANGGYGLCPVARVSAWSINLVFEPWPPRQTFLIEEQARNTQQVGVDRCERFGG